MREIKFRAWDKENNRMVNEPYYFEVHHYSDENRVNRKTYRYYEDWQNLEDGSGFDCELMQFTGLKDRNGNEIYEGDIIKSINVTMYGGKYMVQWDQKFCAYVGVLLNVKPIFLMDFLNAEIVGNIYENENLLSDGR